MQAAQIIRIDISLEVGNERKKYASGTGRCAVAEDRKRRTQPRHHNRTHRQPPGTSNRSGGGSGGIRDRFTVVALITRVRANTGGTGPTIRINGGTNNSYMVLIEGMWIKTNSLGKRASQRTKHGVG